MRNLSIRCGAGKTPGQQLPLPQRSSASMSFGWLFLGGMLSSRARLRFTNREQCAVNSVHRSSLLQRTANYLLTVCLTPGGKRTGAHRERILELSQRPNQSNVFFIRGGSHRYSSASRTSFPISFVSEIYGGWD